MTNDFMRSRHHDGRMLFLIIHADKWTPVQPAYSNYDYYWEPASNKIFEYTHKNGWIEALDTSHLPPLPGQLVQMELFK